LKKNEEKVVEINQPNERRMCDNEEQTQTVHFQLQQIQPMTIDCLKRKLEGETNVCSQNHFYWKIYHFGR
jgi:hypothetical protein